MSLIEQRGIEINPDLEYYDAKGLQLEIERLELEQADYEHRHDLEGIERAQGHRAQAVEALLKMSGVRLY